MDTAQQNQDPKMLWWRDVRRECPIYLAGLFAMLLTNGSEILAPKTLQWILDALFSVASALEPTAARIAFNGVLKSAFIFVWVALGGLVGRYLWRMTFARMTHVAGNTMKLGIWDAIRGTPLDHLSRYTLGDLMNRSIGDVNAARWIYGFTMVLTCDTVFFTVLGSASMIAINPRLALLCLATFIVIPPVVVRMSRQEYKAHDDAQIELTTLSEHVSQSVRGVRAQRASHSFQSWVDALKQSAGRYAGLRLKARLIAINSYPLCSVPTILSYVILMLLGPALVVRHQITIGEFAALASYVYLLQGPLAEVGDLVSEWQRGFASLRRIEEIRKLPRFQEAALQPFVERSSTGVPPEGPAARGTELVPPALEIIDLCLFRGNKQIFDHIFLTLPPGQWLGVYGAVGCGKSSLLQVISGLIAPRAGIIKCNGVSRPCDLRGTLSRSTFRDTVYAPERPFIFGGTIRHNLSLGQNFMDQDLWRALEVVCLANEIRKIPQELDGIVGEGGVALSGGQRQRLALARILLRASPLVLLDDPLSAVDVSTESHIVKNLREAWMGRTVVWSSNKLSTLSCCDLTARLTPAGLRFDNLAGVGFERYSDEVGALNG